MALNTAGNPPLLNNIQGGINLPPQSPAPTPTPGAGARQILPGLDRRIVDIPPPGETRMIQDEVVVQIATRFGPDQLQNAVRRLGLTVIASETLTSTGSTVVRLRITDGKTPAQAIGSLRNVGMAAIVQPNYVYALQQQSGDPTPSARGDTGQQGDPAQYILEKLKISDVHRLARGTNVPIAVIDSQIDAGHPDLEGVIAKRFSAVGAEEKPHAHGTGMAGAIASRQRLVGTAPAARLLAVHAFSTSAATAESTTFNILKGIDWSVKEGARIINMSFAGPKDPSLERAIKLAYDRGIVLIAAAGNAGPKSPPLFPGADPERDRGDGDRCGRQAVQWRQSRQIHLGRGARRRHPGAGARGQLSGHHRHVGGGRRGERHRGAAARTQPETHPGRHPPHSDLERKAARVRRP